MSLGWYVLSLSLLSHFTVHVECRRCEEVSEVYSQSKFGMKCVLIRNKCWCEVYEKNSTKSEVTTSANVFVNGNEVKNISHNWDEKIERRMNPKLKYCGLRPGYSDFRGHIVGGKRAKENQFPWQVGVQYKDGDDFLLTGGGVIISNRWIMTAAHLFQSRRTNVSNYRAVIGTTDLRNERFIYSFDRLIQHPYFNKTTFENDIALLRTSQPIMLYPKYNHSNSVCLTKVDNFVQDVEVSGWGSTATDEQYSDHLSFIRIGIQSDSFCKQIYDVYKKKLMFCAGELGTSDVCYGDSGGPAVAMINNRFYLIGIVSFGKAEGCALDHIPAVFTRVSHYDDWIRSVTDL